MSGASPAVHLRGVSKSFREGATVHSVLADLDLELSRGESVALLGASGSGKSTLLDVIGGLLPPDEGEVWVGGERLDAMSERDRTLFRRRSIGFVFQAFHLIPTLTVLENVLLALDLDGRADDEAEARARAWLARLGLDGREASFPDRLSGGERQRAALARAVVHRPELVLADEPTGNLDGETASDVLDALFEVVAEQGATLLLVTHSELAANRCQRIVQMDELRAVVR